MGLLPRITKCPCCSTLSLVKIDKTTQDNPFKNLSDWIIRKRFSCRKCKELLGLFFHRSNSEEKVIWLNMIECENRYYDKLNVLEKRKNKLVKIEDKKYYETLKEIKNIKNQIRLDKIKLKIKFKIQKKEILPRQIY